MKLQWTDSGLDDLVRLHEFLAPVSSKAAAKVVQSLVSAAARLPEHPRIGEALEHYRPREVRRLIVGPYELRYEVHASAISVLRLWHTRERR